MCVQRVEVIAAARHTGSSEWQETRIVCFENMSDYTHQLDSVVPMDEPIFKATPSEIRFANFVAFLKPFRTVLEAFVLFLLK